MAQHHIDYSVVICAYNPDERILKRCLKAVGLLDKSELRAKTTMDDNNSGIAPAEAGLRTEVILVDNNSDIALTELDYIQKFAEEIPEMVIIRVSQPGVKYARMAAIEKSKGNYIVYIDSDNEPASDYLLQLKKLNAQYPKVACWGPGIVEVDFLDGIDEDLESYARTAFQEKHATSVAFDNVMEWQSCYPYGTGLCSFEFILKDYIRESNAGRFTLTGRTGNKLTSGEDTEMVLLAIRNGYAVGSSPTLKLNHLIPRSRANLSYLKRLAFGTSSCYETCLLQVFPERKIILEKKIISRYAFSRKALNKFYRSGFGRKQSETWDLIRFIGLHVGDYQALNRPLPVIIRWLINYLKLI